MVHHYNIGTYSLTINEPVCLLVLSFAIASDHPLTFHSPSFSSFHLRSYDKLAPQIGFETRNVQTRNWTTRNPLETYYMQTSAGRTFLEIRLKFRHDKF